MKMRHYSLLLMIALLGLSVGCHNVEKVTDEIPVVEQMTLFVGTYTDGTGSHGVYLVDFDESTLEFAVCDSLSLGNPSFLCEGVDSLVYAVSESGDKSALHEIVCTDGKMSVASSMPINSADPCYVASSGEMVATASYSGGEAYLWKKGVATDTLRSIASGADATGRQDTGHMHCSAFTPDGKAVATVDFSGDRIVMMPTHGGNITQIQLPPASGPRHVIYNNKGTRAYAVTELSGCVHVMDYDPQTFALTMKQTVVADSVQAHGSADIHLSPDERFLYVSNRLKADGIVVFRVGDDGTLVRVGYQPTGLHPRNFMLTPSGRHLLVACRDDNRIEVYARDADTGLLTPTDCNIVLPSPVCVIARRQE